jgi:hypothetical protein
MNMSQRADYAERIEQDFRQFDASLPSELRYEVACSIINGNDPNSLRLASKSLQLYSSSLFARCVLMRSFLMEPDAPLHLRFACLKHARKIIESVHVLATLCNCPWVRFPPAWNAYHVFAAATTFATIFLSDETKRGGQRTQESWPDKDLDWFASVLFEVVDTFDLVAQGTQHHTARVCKGLLVALCNSRDELKDRIRQRGKGAQRPATPTLFSVHKSHDNTPRSEYHLDPGLRASKMEATFGQTLQQPMLGTSDSIMPMENNGSSSLDFMLDQISHFDPWEWARLTANLDAAA